MASRPVTSDFLDMVTHGGELEYRLHEISIPGESALVGRTLAEAQIRSRSGALVLSIHRADGSLDMQPRATSVMSAGDTLVVIGTQDQLEQLEKMLRGEPAEGAGSARA